MLQSHPARREPLTLAEGMEYRRIGDTSLNVSIAGFGASPLGNVFGKTDPVEAISAVRYAIDQGINFFDVSPYYGLTVAESRLGEALAGYRHKVVLATKCGRYGEQAFDFSAARIQQSVDESLKRLRTDYVDLLHAHDVEFGDMRQIIDETIPAMRKLQQEGKARYIGITGYPLKTLMRIAEEAPVDTVLTYCRYNLMVDDMEETLVPFAQQHGIGIINASALHMGLLTEAGAPPWHPAPQEVKDAGRRVVELCRARGVDAVEVALRFCFENPHVASTLVGMATREQVQANLKALEAASDVELIDEIRSTIGPVFNYVWPSGRPENQS